MRLTILYRGPLSSCNYDCHYCPFAKQVDSAEQLAVDRKALQRFVNWCASSGMDELRIFFTPWGEALTRQWYWDAFVVLTSLPNVSKVAVQTNLSCRLNWLKRCDRAKVGLWCTYHPSQTTRLRFLSQVRTLCELGIRHSVGMVGLKDDIDKIEQLRQQLPSRIYLWINAYKGEPDYYTATDIGRLATVDSHFTTNTVRHSSLNQACHCGDSVISVDGDGTIRQCHFVDRTVGNIYEDNLRTVLRPSHCPNQTCGCHIGYVHMPHLNLYPIYGDGVLERIPVERGLRVEG